jgi:GT2 family glycosyltransferase
MENYSIIVITHDRDLALPVQQSLLPLYSDIFYAPNYPSFSKVVNEAIVSAKEEIVIICSYKTRPKKGDVEEIIRLLNEGYGFVALYRYAFFGFRKELIRRIGFFDERYVGGAYEDCDFSRRLSEANIGFIEAETIEYITKPSTWDSSFTKNHFENKWTEYINNTNYKDSKIKRNLQEEKYNYNIGQSDSSIIYKTREYTKAYSNFRPNDKNFITSELFYRYINFIK